MALNEVQNHLEHWLQERPENQGTLLDIEPPQQSQVVRFEFIT